MIDPIYIEKAFHSLQSALNGLHSKRERLFAINDFLQLLSPHDSRYDTYRDQIKAHLPEFNNAYELTGIDPAGLETILLQLKNQFKEDSSVTRYSESLEVWVSIAYQWVGKKNQTEQRSAVTLFDSHSGILPATHTVLVPVVENLGQHATGRLRNLTVKTIGQTPASKHELTQVFSVLAGSSRQESSSIIQNAVNQLLIELKLTDKKHWQVTASFEHNDAWHSGNSADLAMGGLFFCALLEAMELKEQFRLNPAIAITGELSKTGEVKEVATESIQQKIEAAFFSWTQVLVVPQSQLGVVYKQYEKLKEKYPKRELLIIGVQHLRDLFYDRRLTIHTKKGTLQHVSQKLWKRKFNAISVIGYLILASIIAVLVIGPVDRNPVIATYEGEMMHVQNKNGNIIYSERVGELQVSLVNEKQLASVLFTDINNDGINEVLKIEFQKDDLNQQAFHLLSYDFQDTLWSIDLNFEIPFESHPNLSPHKYDIDDLTVYDLDNDGQNEIVASLSHSSFFPSFIGVFDIASGELERYYAVPGNTRLYIIDDLDQDGYAEIIIGVQLKGYRLNAMIVLPHNFENSRAPLGLRYTSSIQPGIEKAIIGFPTSIVGRSYYTNRGELGRYGSISNIRFASEIENILVTFYEISRKNSEELANLGLLYTFNKQLDIINIGSNDNYDVISEELYRNGEISTLPDATFLESYKDSLVYWNGTDWVNEPTLNPAYLESVGEDSTYYKAWYFKKD